MAYVIKRYSNRKLYDTQESRYVTLEEIEEMIRSGKEIQVVDGRLQITGQRRERDLPCEQYHRVERGHGSFSRTFEFPLPVDEDRVTADLRDGVLIITCPKATDGGARRIRVS